MPHLNLSCRNKSDEESLEDYLENYVKPTYEILKSADIKISDKAISFRRYPIAQNMEADLEHIVTEEKGRGSRRRFVVMPERCACIGWIKEILEGVGEYENILWYREERNKIQDLIIVLSENSDGPPYKIVLSPRPAGWLLKTAYPLRKARLEQALATYKEFQEMIAKGE